jgi:HKD family nuclease
MKKAGPTVSLLKQAPASSGQLYKRINTLLEVTGLERFRVAVAYARWEGIGLIAPQIEKLLEGGGEFQSIYGVANKVTTPDSLLYSLNLQTLYSTHTYAGTIEDEFANSIFHPKFFEFRYQKKTVVIIGSANLTGGGLARNTELSVEVQFARGDPFEKQIEAAWKSMRAGSRKLTLALIRKLKKQSELASERDRGENLSSTGKKKFVSGGKVSPKPLFTKVLGISGRTKRSKIFSEMDTLTVRPRRLYLQILRGETGGQVGGAHPGYQIQLPVATLATFFGVGENESKEVTFRFPSDTVIVHLTHFPNHTHRVRLRPLRDIKRPAIVIFQRLGPDEYKCTVVPRKEYKKILGLKCTEQQRVGARLWGLE